MWLLLLEAALALALLVFIVLWTMWPKRKDFKRADAGAAEGEMPGEAGQEARQRNRPGDGA